MPMPRVNESDEDQDQVFSAEFEDEEDHEPAVDEAHEVLGPVEAVQSMKKEFDSLVERMNGKITELQTVIQEVPFTAPRVPGTRHKSMSSKEALAQAKEPSVLVKRRENRTKEEEEKKEKMQHSSRRYGASVGGRDGSNDIRLHGRWMELATQFSGQPLDSKPGARQHVKAPRHSTLEMLEEAGLCFPLWHPTGYFKLIWDGMSILVTLLDAFTMPVSLAWDTYAGMADAGSYYSLIVFWITFFFWLLDMPVTLNTAVYKNGEIRKKRYIVLCTYLRTWFLFDISLISLDVMTIFTLSRDNTFSAIRSF